MTAPVNISVLVPVYNVEPYLAQCLESICSQTLRELEVVCVDDASTDGSLSILREFAERDPRVKVVQAPENGGLSRSRNLAMNHAVGEYLFLVDSDDWLETDLLEEMYRRAKALDADRLACGFRYYYESAPDREDRFLPEDMAPPEKGWLPCTPETIGKIHHGAGGMMIRRSIVEKHGIRFPEGVACEDLYFHYAVFPWCRRVCVVSRAAYVYRKRAGSITSERFCVRQFPPVSGLPDGGGAGAEGMERSWSSCGIQDGIFENAGNGREEHPQIRPSCRPKGGYPKGGRYAPSGKSVPSRRG